METLGIEITLSKINYIWSQCIYRAPNNDMTDFNEKCMDNLNMISTKSSFVCGDFNIDLLKSDQHNPTTIFIDQLFGAGYYPLITKTNSYYNINKLYFNR